MIWGKLRLLLQLMNQTMGENHAIGYENIYEVLTYVGAQYATHSNMRGHTSGDWLQRNMSIFLCIPKFQVTTKRTHNYLNQIFKGLDF